jgi:DNA-3-methyladenine glycosylase II
MLSRKAAASIYSRLQTKAKEEGLSGTWELRDAHLAACGVSSRKIKTIKCFRTNYIRDPGYYQNWKNLSPNSLLQEVNKQWGMSDWTSNMLSIFHFGHEDVFPENDGSIKRALNLAHELINRSAKLDPKAAKPYRSYLALYLWQALDHGILKSQKTR